MKSLMILVPVMSVAACGPVSVDLGGAGGSAADSSGGRNGNGRAGSNGEGDAGERSASGGRYDGAGNASSTGGRPDGSGATAGRDGEPSASGGGPDGSGARDGWGGTGHDSGGRPAEGDTGGTGGVPDGCTRHHFTYDGGCTEVTNLFSFLDRACNPDLGGRLAVETYDLCGDQRTVSGASYYCCALPGGDSGGTGGEPNEGGEASGGAASGGAAGANSGEPQ